MWRDKVFVEVDATGSGVGCGFCDVERGADHVGFVIGFIEESYVAKGLNSRDEGAVPVGQVILAVECLDAKIIINEGGL